MTTEPVPPKPLDTRIEAALRGLQALTIAVVGFLGMWVGAHLGAYLTCGHNRSVDPLIIVTLTGLGAGLIGYATASFVRWVGNLRR